MQFWVIREPSWGSARAGVQSSLGSKGSVMGILSGPANISVSGIAAILILSFCTCILTPGSKDEPRASPRCPSDCFQRGTVLASEFMRVLKECPSFLFAAPGTHGLLSVRRDLVFPIILPLFSEADEPLKDEPVWAARM